MRLLSVLRCIFVQMELFQPLPPAYGTPSALLRRIFET